MGAARDRTSPDPPQKGRVLVTGGAGFLGVHMSRSLCAAGYQVTALDIHDPGDNFPAGVEFVAADVRNPRAMRDAVEGCEIVIDNAALVPITRSTLEQYRTVNVDGCRNTLEAAAALGAYVLHISSSAIFGVPKQLPVRADSPLTPFEPYGQSKAEAEHIVADFRERGLTIGCLRPRTLLGEGRLGIFDVIFARMRAGKRVPLFGRGNNRVQMCDVDDFCSASLAAIERRATGDYNVGAAEFGTVREDIEALIAHAGTTSKALPIPVFFIRAVLQPLDLVGKSPFNVWHWKSAPAPFYFDITQTVNELGWKPRYSNARALARAYDEYLAKPAATGASPHRRPLAGAVARLLRGGKG